jgi:hypothetical protein
VRRLVLRLHPGLDGSAAVADAAARWRFANPCTGKSVSGLHRHVPPFIARARQDQFPGVNDSLDRFLAKAVHANLPVTFVNHPDGPHAFDLFHDSLTSRDITARRSDSCGAIWALLDRSRPVGTPDRYDIVRGRFYRCSM